MTDQSDWTTSYLHARARVATAYALPEDDERVVNDAAAVARLQLAEQDMAQVITQDQAASTNALLVRLRATEAAPPPDAQEGDPARAPAQAALFAAVAGINSSRPATPIEPDKPADARAGQADGASATKGDGEQASDVAAAAFAKATAALNANR